MRGRRSRRACATGDIASHCSREVALPPTVVIDVGRIEGRGFAVVEANAAWAAGICGCDPDAVLRAVARTCVPTSSLDDITRRWARAASLAIE
ncbi:hypothetical protein DB32_007550 [Sandaracinus amylolyticus]|uniref:ATP-grasp domain-containing protein n=1 Tax=Sandaracinus amylolyticus TaxID=927083 RepID=A0A0F6YMJ1_9BACT|nr:ATP-grasp domain-containing protein [Sandaracinus amylolyticus]AKF10401.1 hypothetical protein DB32_007550 [Sandaracinus amylolyticus]